MKAKVLINLGAQLNLVSQLFVKEASWQLCFKEVLAIETMDSREVQVYSDLHITTNIMDRQGRQQQQQDEYVAMDIHDYDLILGDLWLQTRNPDINQAKGLWAYTERSSPPELTGVGAFFKAAAEAQCLYTIHYVPDSSKGLELLAKYEDYRDVFSEDKANKLPPYGWLEHAIELTDEPPHGPIYSLLEKELKVLCEYIQENLG